MSKNLNYAALRRNLIALIQEFQVKLGDTREPIGLYYPAESLNRLLGADLDAAGLRAALDGFVDVARDTLGEVTATDEGGMICLRVPAEGVAYVRNSLPAPAFLRDFIAAITRHGLTLDELRAVFQAHSRDVRVERIDSDEFDYLLYFGDGVPDDFRYCVKFEGPHAIYHRFTPGDYQALGFPEGVPVGREEK